MSGRTVSSESKWVTVELGPKLHQNAKAAAVGERSTLQDFCLQAIARATYHDVSIGEPSQRLGELQKLVQLRGPANPTPSITQSPSELPLNEYAKHATAIIIVGTTLRSVTDEEMFAGFIRKKAQDKRVTLTFGLLGERLLKEDAVLDQIDQRRARRDSPGIKREVADSMQFLSDLKRTAEAEVRIIGLNTLPTLGLTVLDPDTADARLRVSFYLHKHPDKCDPVLHLSKSDPEAARGYELFIGHYRRLLEDSETMA